MEIYECMISQWDEHDTFDSDQLPFFIEMFSLHHKRRKYVGLDLRLQYIEFMEARYSTVQYSTVQYIEFMEARFRFKNLHYCGKPWEEIIGKCNPRCVRIKKTDKKDNQAYHHDHDIHDNDHHNDDAMTGVSELRLRVLDD